MKLVKTLPDSTVHFAVKFLSATLSSSWTPFLPVWLPLFPPVLPAEINTVHYLENQKMQSWCSQTSAGVCVCRGVGVEGEHWERGRIPYQFFYVISFQAISFWAKFAIPFSSKCHLGEGVSTFVHWGTIHYKCECVALTNKSTIHMFMNEEWQEQNRSN